MSNYILLLIIALQSLVIIHIWRKLLHFGFMHNLFVDRVINGFEDCFPEELTNKFKLNLMGMRNTNQTTRKE